MAENKALALLRYGNLSLLVKTPYQHKEADFETMQYFYEDKLCPHDCISEVVTVVDLTDMNADPHGIFEFIGEVKAPENIHGITSDNIKELLTEHLEKLKPI